MLFGHIFCWDVLHDVLNNLNFIAMSYTIAAHTHTTKTQTALTTQTVALFACRPVCQAAGSAGGRQSDSQASDRTDSQASIASLNQSVSQSISQSVSRGPDRVASPALSGS